MAASKLKPLSRKNKQNLSRRAPDAFIRLDMERIAFVGDIHAPFHDESAVELAYDFLAWFKPHTVYVLGDIVDFYTLSRFDSDPDRVRGLQSEIDSAVEILAKIRKIVGKESKMIFKEGNHEYRLTRYLWRNPELGNFRDMQLPSMLKFSDFDISYSPYREILHSNSFLIEHGDIARKFSGYTAKGMMDKRGASGISGHTHRLGVHHRSHYGGVLSWYENGCLCRLDPEFIIGLPDWQQGFTIGHSVRGKSTMQLEQLMICGGQLHYGDKVFVREVARNRKSYSKQLEVSNETPVANSLFSGTNEWRFSRQINVLERRGIE